MHGYPQTASDLALVELFLANEGETRDIQEIPPADLDRYLTKFLVSVRKKSRDEYEPTTLRGFIASVDRYLKKFRYSESVITGQFCKYLRCFEVKTETIEKTW